MSDLPLDPAAHDKRTDVPGTDLLDATNSSLAQRIREQTDLRDKLSKDRKNVYIFCADGQSADCDESSKERWLSSPPNKLVEITRQVDDALHKGSFATTLKQPEPYTLYNRLSGGSSPSSKPPMLLRRDSYWDIITRPYEIKLAESLSRTSGVITHAQMVSRALELCNNDRQLSILVLANFTKDMASIERRQVTPDQIAPEMRDGFSKSNIDSIFNRIEGYADDATQKYNKEGAIYHFYGAMYASSVLGPGGRFGAWAYNNLNLRKFGHGGSSDPIKDWASTLGAKFSWGMTPSELLEQIFPP